MSRGLKIIAGLTALALVGGLLWLSVQGQPAHAPTVQTATATVEVQAAAAASFQRFDQLSLADGPTALQLTQAVVPVVVSGEGANAFVTSIAGQAAREEAREFWLLKINGEKATVGAGSYYVQPADTIRWEIDTY